MTIRQSVRLVPVLSVVLACLPALAAQPEQAPAAATPSEPRKPTGEHLPDKLPAGQAKVLQATVMEARGTAEWRPGDQDAWKAAKVDDLLSPGAQIRTGRQSSLTLRVGHNATVMVSAMTRVDLPSIVQDGETLRTRASVVRGKADFKVDQVGLTNDFQVLTPSTTLAVRGTGFGVGWGGLEGAKIQSLAGNQIRAVELKYFASRLTYYLSEKGTSTEAQKEPLQGALFNTVSPPATMALALETAQIAADAGFIPNLATVELLDVDQAHQSLDDTEELAGVIEDPTEGLDEFLSLIIEFFGSLDLESSLLVADALCDNLAFFDKSFIVGLMEAQLVQSSGDSTYNNFISQLSDFCEGGMEGSEAPLADFFAFITAYCSTFTEQGQIDTCIIEALDSLGETLEHIEGSKGKGKSGGV